MLPLNGIKESLYLPLSEFDIPFGGRRMKHSRDGELVVFIVPGGKQAKITADFCIFPTSKIEVEGWLQKNENETWDLKLKVLVSQ